MSVFWLKYLMTGGLCQSHIGIIQVITDVRRFSEENLYYSEAIEANRLLHYIIRLFKTRPFAATATSGAEPSRYQIRGYCQEIYIWHDMDRGYVMSCVIYVFQENASVKYSAWILPTERLHVCIPVAPS
jgi:hypothetical protein